ncbi:MAG TPA: VOC family protein [Dongiaceae bacterium]|nr:VOC family protein [Dongiaceae bacterium]
MKRIAAVTGMCLWSFVMIGTTSSAKDLPKAHIYGIAGVRIYVSNVALARPFYMSVTDTTRACDWCESPEPSGFHLPSGQFILLSPTEKGTSNFIAELSFWADNLQELSKRLKANKIRFHKEEDNGQLSMLRVQDPEGHSIAFLKSGSALRYKAYHANPSPSSALKEILIHAGWVVKDREAMDKFYRDVLGFHLYWQGGMKDERVDWVSMQVPDGTDWIEYMLNIPPDASKHLLGVMNHIALGVPSVRDVAEQLKKNGVKLTEEPKIGRDGKWQLNLYDPDDTRVEFMEFTPVEKPCCSEFTGTHPKP